jgi:hypothetical protein
MIADNLHTQTPRSIKVILITLKTFEVNKILTLPIPPVDIIQMQISMQKYLFKIIRRQSEIAQKRDFNITALGRNAFSKEQIK